MQDNLFRWGILSTAKIGRQQVTPAIAQSYHGTVHAIASRSADRARAEAARFNAATWYDDYDALLADPEVDGVYIPLPTAQHAHWAIRAAEAGKHVLCEKPIALRADQIDPIIAARDRTGVTLSEAFMVYYHPQWHKVRDLLAQGAIGRLRLVRGGFSYFNRDPDNMRNRPELGGGALPDIGVYPVVTTLITTGAVAGSVSASVSYSPEFGTDVFAQARISMGDFDLSFFVSTDIAQHQSMQFFGEDGWIELTAPFNSGSYDFPEVRLHDAGHGHCQVFRFPDVNQYVLQVDAFARACRGSGEDLFALEMSRRVQEIIDRIYDAGGQRPTA